MLERVKHRCRAAEAERFEDNSTTLCQSLTSALHIASRVSEDLGAARVKRARDPYPGPGSEAIA